jgi:hypothetical protein
MARLIERLAIVCTALCGIVYGERLVRTTVSMVARLDPTHLHGVIVTGSALGFVQAGIAVAVIVVAVVPALLSLFDARRMPAGLVVGELVAALLLFGASQQVLRQSVHARIVGTGQARVLALQASATPEAVE